jgi:hypothetical protein
MVATLVVGIVVDASDDWPLVGRVAMQNSSAARASAGFNEWCELNTKREASAGRTAESSWDLRENKFKFLGVGAGG